MCLFIAAATATYAQTEKLGVVNYTPPQGMTKTSKENVVAFSQYDENTGKFFTITLYGATPGTGNAQSDFAREWNNLVVKPFAVARCPHSRREVDMPVTEFTRQVR